MPLLGQPAIRRFHRSSDGILSGVDGLARAKADLAHGDARKARDRLKGLVAAYPHNEEVRSLLAEAYRRDRQWPEAGRWGYLIGPAATERERRAFESHSVFGWYPRITEARLRRLLHVDDLAKIADQSGRARLRDLPRKRNPLRKEGLVATIGRYLATRRANSRHMRVLGCRPADRVEADTAAMMPRPPVAPVTGWRASTRLPRDHYVRLDSNDYSVHPGAVGRRVDVAAGLERVVVTCDGKVVADHPRSWAKHQSFTDPAHATAAAVLRRAHVAALSAAGAPRQTDVQVRDLASYDTALGIDTGIGTGIGTGIDVTINPDQDDRDAAGSGVA